MARLTIDLGTAGNSATGDSVRGAFNKVNQNFEELYVGLLRSDSTGGLLTTDVTNGDVRIQPNGVGIIEIDKLKITDDDITTLVTNGNIAITGNGTGGVTIEGVTFNGTSLSSADSTQIQINEQVDLGGNKLVNLADPTADQHAATKSYVDTQLSSSSHSFTFVGDDSTGTAVTQGETFKIAGTQNITTAVSGDTLTITGPDLTNYLNSTQISVSGNKISSTESNADIELDPAGTGDIVVNSGNVLPATDNTQYLGSASKRWHTLYVGPGSININGVSISESSGTIQIPGGLTGTQGLGALLLADPTQIPYSDVDNQGAAFTFDSNTVFYDTETKEAIATKVSSDLDWAGWTIGDAFPNSLGLTPATFTHTHSAGSLTGLKLASGGSGMTDVATDNILAFRVGDPITTFIVTPYSGLLGTVSTQSSTQSDLTATNSLSVGGLATVYGESIFYDNLDVKGNKITNLGTPTASGDAATKAYVDAQNTAQALTFVGDDSTGTAVNSGETFKIAGATGITTAVSGDTLTVTGPDLTNYLNSTQISVSGNKIITTESNADIELDPNGTGDVIINSGDVLPLSDNVQSLGSADKRWKDVHIGPGSLIAYTPAGVAITLGYLALSKLVDYAQSTAQTSSLNLLKRIEDAGFTEATATATKNQQDSGFTIQTDGSTPNFVISNSLTNGNVDIVPNGTGKVNIDNIEISSTEITTNTADSNLTLTPNGSGSVVADTVTIKNRVISTSDSNADITITPTGTGSVIADTLKIKANEILPTAGNTNLTLSGTGTGKVISSKPHQFNAGYIEVINALTSSSSISVDCSLASVHTVTLTENTAFTINNLPTGGTVTLIITQDGTGGRTATFSGIKFAGGTPTLSTAGGAIDVVTIFNDGVNYLGNIAKAYA